MTDYNRPDQYYVKMSAIRPPTFKRNDLELEHGYFTLVGHQPYHGLPHEKPMDHLEQFEDLLSAIKANGFPNDYLLC